MKRIIASILLVAVMLTGVIGALTSCGGGNKPAPDFVMPENGYDGSEVTIRFYHTNGAALSSILTDAIEVFNAMYPNITIDHKSYGDYDALLNQISTEVTVGNQPHIAYCYPDHVATYNEAGAVQTLDVFINSDIVVNGADGSSETIGYTKEQIDDFIDAYYKEGQAFGDGKMYSIALAKSTEVLYYNKTKFDELGLDVPTTWEEVEQVCLAFKEYDEKCIPLGYDSEANWFITMCEQYGSDYTSATGENFLFNNKTNRDFVNKFRQMFQDKLVITKTLSGGYTSALFTGEVKSDDTESLAAKGTRCYMCIGSTGGATYQQPMEKGDGYDFEVGIAPIPQVNPDDPKVISQGPSLCLFKKENPQEVLASWLFAKFLTTNVEYQARVSESNGYVPVMKSVQSDPTFAQFLKGVDVIKDKDGNVIEEVPNNTKYITAYAVRTAIEQAEHCYTSPAFSGSSVARIQVGLLLNKCFTVRPGEQLTDDDLKKIFDEYVAECKYQSGQ